MSHLSRFEEEYYEVFMFICWVGIIDDTAVANTALWLELAAWLLYKAKAQQQEFELDL